MRLGDWINRQNLIQKDVAKDLGVTQPTVARWVKGEIPSFSKIVMIKNLTNGEVSFEDFIKS